MNKIKLKLKLKVKFRLQPFLFIRNKKAVYEDSDGASDVYELFKLVFPFVYKYTGTWTIHERGRPFDFDRLNWIIARYKKVGHV